jgi:hypothetical protein
MTAVTILILTLGFVVCVLIPLVVWRRLKWLRMVLALGLLAMQVLLLVHMSTLGRHVMAGVIQAGGPVREVSNALMALRDAQWPAALALMISGAGLFLLAALHRNSSGSAKGRQSQVRDPSK